MGVTAEGSICAHLAVAQLEITAFRNVERNRSASGSDELALSVAKRIVPTVTAGTPVIFLSSVKVDIDRVVTSV